MRRLFWVALGATAGVLLVRRVTQAAHDVRTTYSPAGISQSVSGSLAGLAEAVREFGQQVREGMAEREAELRSGLGLDGSHDVVDAHTTGLPSGSAAGSAVQSGSAVQPGSAGQPDADGFRLAADPTGEDPTDTGGRAR